ncbi:MAG: HypC/HybG/HupF family hydrogenase formation chaperone [Halobacteriales archaeon]
MCLGIPGEVLEVDGDKARAEFWGTQKWVQIDIVGEEITEGDYVLNHAGFAIRKISEEEVEQTVEYYESLLGTEEGEDLDVEALDGVGGGAGPAGGGSEG